MELELDLSGITMLSNWLAACFCIPGDTWAYVFIVKTTDEWPSLSLDNLTADPTLEEKGSISVASIVAPTNTISHIRFTSFIQAWLIIFGKYGLPRVGKKPGHHPTLADLLVFPYFILCLSVESENNTGTQGTAQPDAENSDVLGDLKVTLLFKTCIVLLIDSWQPSKSTSLDQALLAMAYIETFQVTGKEVYARTTREIFTYVLRDMTAENGGFYSAEDADSEGEEGKFYLWTYDEIKQILTPEEADLTFRVFNIKKEGNFKGERDENQIGRSILHMTKPANGATLDRLKSIRI